MSLFKIKEIHVHKNGRLFGFGVSPSDDWKILSVIFFTLALVVIGLGTYIFMKINEGEIFVVERQSSTTNAVINKSLLNQTVKYYKARAQTFEDIKNSKEIAPDPSI